METCRLCNRSFKNLKSLTTHINVKHNISGKKYYDEYLKKEYEGCCIVCGNGTTYRNINVGYLVNCSLKCRNINKDFKKKLSESKKGVKQSEETINKRIKNTNQLKKENNRKKVMLYRYGVDNPSKIDSIKRKISNGNKGKIVKRNDEWQNKIINSKRKNGTLKHSNNTKIKISIGVNKHYSSNLDRENNISRPNNSNYFCGWYKGLYFRSSLELSFLIANKKVSLISCEKNKYKIIYEKDGKKKVYYPDYTDGEIIYEIKPSTLLDYRDNNLKIKKGYELYGDKYKVITEKEIPYVKKTEILELIKIGIVKVNEKSIKKLERYKH